MKQAAMYVRVSTNQQKEEATIESQKTVLLQHAKEQGYEISSELIFSDNGFSGAILARPALDKLRDFASEGLIENLFILSPDRLSRKYAYQVILTEELKKNGVKIVFKSSPPSDSAGGALLEQMQGMFAEYERAQIVERTRRGKTHKARNGHVSVLTRAPFGYKYVSASIVQPAYFEVADSEAHIVKTIFELYVKERMSTRKIRDYLFENQISSPKGNKKWALSSIIDLLKTSAYRGIAYYGVRVKAEPDPMRLPNCRVRLNGRKSPLRSCRQRDPSEWIPIPVPVIINNDMFELAQSLRKRNSTLSERNTRQVTLLQGLISCKDCGYGFTRHRTGNKAQAYSYYRCNNPERSQCKNRGIRVDQLDQSIWNSLISILNSPELIHNEISKRLTELEKEPAQEYQRQLCKKIEKLEKELKRLLDAYQEGCIEISDLRIRTGGIKRDINNSKKEMIKASTGLDQGQLLELKIAIQYFSERLKASQEDLSLEEKRKVLRILIQEIKIGPSDITVNHILPVNKLPLEEIVRLRTHRPDVEFQRS